MKKITLIMFTAAWFLSTGCVTVPETKPEVTHVVLFWLKEPGNKLHRNNIINASHSFTNIPGVINVKAGEPLPASREVVDDTFDVALVMTFSDKTAFERPPNHRLRYRSRYPIPI